MWALLLNPALLIGMAGVGLPVLAHLLSRQKYDVVQWGAMQFLELGQKTRRRIKLEELLLLLLRMLIIALVVLALCRPFVTDGMLALAWKILLPAIGVMAVLTLMAFLASERRWSILLGLRLPLAYFTLVLILSLFGIQWLRSHSQQRRDVALILDGSYSMGWEGKAVTPHAAAIQWSHRFLESLSPGDTVAVFDARDRVRGVIDTPTHDFSLIRKELGAIPKPAGSSDIPDAIAQGIRILSKGTNPVREVIVLTDGQARCWNADDEGRWELLDDLQNQQSVKPRLWGVDVGDSKGDRTNFALDRAELSREFAAVNLPVRVKSKIRYSGGQAPVQRKAWLEVDGQRLAESMVQTPMLQPGSEFPLEFEHRFTAVGSHRLSVVLDADNLPGDNRAEAAVTVAEAVPVLLVDGDPHLDPTRSESFFAKAALSPGGTEASLVKATVIRPDQLTAESLTAPQAVCLLNVPRLTPRQADALLSYVAAGGGLLVSPGDKIEPASYNTLLHGDGTRALPAKFQKIDTDPAKPPAPGVNVLDSSLKLPLVSQLRREHDGGFTDARFIKWWAVEVAGPPPKDAPPPPEGVAPPKASEPIVAARLSTNVPVLVLRTYGRGRVAQMTVPLDSDWSTLPAKPDYVTFLHEILFHLAGGTAPSRNVMTGDPLAMPVPKGTQPEKFLFRDPANGDLDPILGGDETRPSLQLAKTDLPGLYRLLPKEQAGNRAAVGEVFVADFDRSESDLKPLDDAARKKLSGKGRLKFVKDLSELQTEFAATAPRSELWRMLMLLMLAFLVGELILTRRLVAGGHSRDEGVEAVER